MRARQTSHATADRLAKRLRSVRCAPSAPDDRPGCGYGLVVRATLGQIRQDVAELKGRVNGLLFAVAAAIAVEVILRLLGA